MEAVLSFNEKKDLFKEKARVGKFEVFVKSICLCWSALFLFWGANGNNIQDVILGFAFAAFAILWFAWSVSSSKVLAVKQCLAVAEKHSIQLTPWQVRSLEANIAAMDVFKQFAEIVDLTKKSLVPEGSFIGSGGMTGESCRNLVRHLWELTPARN